MRRPLSPAGSGASRHFAQAQIKARSLILECGASAAIDVAHCATKPWLKQNIRFTGTAIRFKIRFARNARPR